MNFQKYVYKNDLKRTILSMNDVSNTEINLFDDILFPSQNKFDAFITKALKTKAKVAIVGDYDVDGVMATTILSIFLEEIDINHVSFIPNRFKDGYGLKSELVLKAIAENCNSIITVDNGVNASDAIDFAKAKGVDVLVTDHHISSSKLPNADIITPELDNIKFKEICGAQVIYFLIANSIFSISDKKLLEMKQLASVAVVSDVMPLKNINRKFLKEFLDDVKKDKIINEGLKNLILKSSSARNFNEETIGYQVCPKINASGRLKSADIAFDLFKGNDFTALMKLELLNDLRKAKTKEALFSLKLQNNCVITSVLNNTDDYAEGIIGILAGRVSEDNSKPAFVFVEKDRIFKGSGRSPENYNLIEGVKRVIAKHPKLLLNYGGHAGAMGLSIESTSKIDEFRTLLSEDYKENKTKEHFVQYIDIDDINLNITDIIKEQNELAPYGNGFEKPIYHIVATPMFISKLGSGTCFTIRRKNGELLKVNNFNKSILNKEYDLYFTLNGEIYKEKEYSKGILVDMKAL